MAEKIYNKKEERILNKSLLYDIFRKGNVIRLFGSFEPIRILTSLEDMKDDILYGHKTMEECAENDLYWVINHYYGRMGIRTGEGTMFEVLSEGVALSNAPENLDIHGYMSQYDFESEPYGRSSIRNRNGIRYRSKKTSMEHIYYVDNDEDDDIARIPEKEYDVEIPDNKEVIEALHKCTERVEKEKEVKAEAILLQHSIDGNIACLTATEGRSGDKPSCSTWECIWQFRTACTSDHRYGVGHTYLMVFLKKDVKNTLSLCRVKIPDEYKGAFIGKQGKNIKALCDENKIIIKLV